MSAEASTSKTSAISDEDDIVFKVEMENQVSPPSPYVPLHDFWVTPPPNQMSPVTSKKVNFSNF